MNSDFDFLIVGAGFSGLVLAERLSTQLGCSSLVVEKRDHIGGNAYDYSDSAGVRVHKYGPHYFRTNSDRVVQYLSQFTQWYPVEYEVRSFTEGRFWHFPVNLNTFEQLLGRQSTTGEFEEWLRDQQVEIKHPQNSEELIVSQVGWELYKKFYEGYTLKHWKRHPRELAPSVCGRIPIRTNRDDRYLSESFQALPRDGYTPMFERLLEAAGPNVTVQLNTSFEDARNNVSYRHLIYTGAIDAYFEHFLGKLPYRSLRFEFESFSPTQLMEREREHGKPGFWQPFLQVNYPNDHDFTRIVEIKHATGQSCEHTTIVREYPEDFVAGGEPYYPVPTSESEVLYRRYKELTAKEENVSFVGRLARYRYYNMDQVTAMALKEFERLAEHYGSV
jgi:UDP-galactopyranose mutase